MSKDKHQDALSFADIVSQVVLANRAKMINSNVISEFDRNIKFDPKAHRRSTICSDFIITKQSTNTETLSLHFKGEVQGSKRPSKEQNDLIIETFDSDDDSDSIIETNTTNNPRKNIKFKGSNKNLVSNEEEMNTTRRLISSPTASRIGHFKTNQHRMSVLNKHPCLTFVNQIIKKESKNADQVQVFRLYNKLKIYEFLTSLFTLISN
jgi:hypothetical protein